MEFPPQPEPHTIEVEATNYCSAKCTFCPHPRMTRPKGYLNIDQFRTFLVEVQREREQFWLNTRAGQNRFPRIVFAGLGEPTLHPQIAELVALCEDYGFTTRVVTNGAHLKPDLIERFVSARLSSLAISLHSLNPEIYRETMSIPLQTTLPKITRALERLSTSNVDVELWRVYPPPGKRRDTEADQQKFDEFVSSFSRVKVLGPSEPWDRDGTVPNTVVPLAIDGAQGRIWCHNAYFTHNISWDGEAVLCCVDYHRRTVPLGNVFSEGFSTVQQRRQAVYLSGPQTICQNCTKWIDQDYGNLYDRYLSLEPL